MAGENGSFMSGPTRMTFLAGAGPKARSAGTNRIAAIINVFRMALPSSQRPAFLAQRGRPWVSKSLPPRSGPQAFDDPGDDRVAVEAAVLDEDPVGFLSRDDRAGDEEARHVGLERRGVVRGRARRRVDTDARLLEQADVGVIPGQ